MMSRSQNYRRQNSGRVLDGTLQTFLQERHTNLVRRQQGGLISVPGNLTSARMENSGPQSSPRLTRLLVKVNIERSLGPVQVVKSPEDTVNDLVKAVVEIYVKEKRRPLLKETDPECFQLHYSQFSLESLKPEEKLIDLGSRNFFLCSKPSTAVNSSCSKEAKMAAKSPFPLTKLMDFLL